MEVICIDDKFDSEVYQVFQQLPVEGPIYSIRDMGINADGEPWVLLNEIHNKHILHSSGLGTYEPRFRRKRFTDLLGNSIENVVFSRIEIEK